MSYGDHMSYGAATGSIGRQDERSANAVPSPRSTTPIRDHINRIEDMMAEVHGGVSAIEERLETVTRGGACPPEMAPEVAKSSDDSNVGGRLSYIVKNLQHLNTRLQSLHARIDV